MRTMLRIILGCVVGFAVSTLADQANAKPVGRVSVQRPRVTRPQIARPARVSVSVQRPQQVKVTVQRANVASVNVSRPASVRPQVNRVRSVNVATSMSVGGTKSSYAPRGTISGGSTARLTQPIKEMTIAAVQPSKPLVYPRTTVELWTTPPPRVDEEADAEEFVE